MPDDARDIDQPATQLDDEVLGDEFPPERPLGLSDGLDDQEPEDVGDEPEQDGGEPAIEVGVAFDGDDEELNVPVVEDDDIGALADDELTGDETTRDVATERVPSPPRTKPCTSNPTTAGPTGRSAGCSPTPDRDPGVQAGRSVVSGRTPRVDPAGGLEPVGFELDPCRSARSARSASVSSSTPARRSSSTAAAVAGGGGGHGAQRDPEPDRALDAEDQRLEPDQPGLVGARRVRRPTQAPTRAVVSWTGLGRTPSGIMTSRKVVGDLVGQPGQQRPTSQSGSITACRRTDSTAARPAAWWWWPYR